MRPEKSGRCYVIVNVYSRVAESDSLTTGHGGCDCEEDCPY